MFLCDISNGDGCTQAVSNLSPYVVTMNKSSYVLRAGHLTSLGTYAALRSGAPETGRPDSSGFEDLSLGMMVI